MIWTTVDLMLDVALLGLFLFLARGFIFGFALYAGPILGLLYLMSLA